MSLSVKNTVEQKLEKDSSSLSANRYFIIVSKNREIQFRGFFYVKKTLKVVCDSILQNMINTAPLILSSAPRTSGVNPSTPFALLRTSPTREEARLYFARVSKFKLSGIILAWPKELSYSFPHQFVFLLLQP